MKMCRHSQKTLTKTSCFWMWTEFGNTDVWLEGWQGLACSSQAAITDTLGQTRRCKQMPSHKYHIRNYLGVWNFSLWHTTFILYFVLKWLVGLANVPRLKWAAVGCSEMLKLHLKKNTFLFLLLLRNTCTILYTFIIKKTALQRGL